MGRWFESESAKAKRHAKNRHRWQQDLIDVESEKPLRQHQCQQQRTAWAEQYANWKFDTEEHEKRLVTTQTDTRQQFRIDTVFFESYLAAVLAETEWQRETPVAFEINPEQSTVLLKVDLAEIEDFPDKIYGIYAQRTKLTEKTMTQKAVRENYARHVYGCVFRLVGIVLHTLPFDNVIVSGFTQRVSKRIGYLEDEYILSRKCTRSQMSSVNFEDIEYEDMGHIDPVEAFGGHPVIRKMSNTFIFQPIEPQPL